MALLFFEPSTRTKASFAMAAYRLEQHVLPFEINSSSSISKGESALDTVRNIAAMGPDLIVLRSNQDIDQKEVVQNISVPIVSGGWGEISHPTQALLDCMTLIEEFGALSKLKVLISGDIAHSRVAKSNFELMTRLGAEVRFFIPPQFRQSTQVSSFETLEEALSWPDVYMGLRVQKERHQQSFIDLDAENKINDNYLKTHYLNHYGLTIGRLQLLNKNCIIMHPGPINYGVEFSEAVMHSKKLRVLNQVENGVYMRSAVMSLMLNLNQEVHKNHTTASELKSIRGERK